MIVVSLSNVPPKLRGFLTKYLWEISPGVYVGDINARIREALWDRIIDNVKIISKAVMVFPADNEQGFDFYSYGSTWKPVDYEGLKLIIRKNDELESGEKRKPCIDLPDEYVVLDIETTGLDIYNDKILEIGAIKIRKGIITEKYQAILKTIVPKEITELTGITQNQADQGVSVKEALIQLKEFIGNNLTVGYNIRMFDLRFIKRECLNNSVPIPVQRITDVIELVRKTYPNLSSYQLSEVARINQIEVTDVHRAISDCELCNKIFCMCNGVDLSGMN